MDAVAEEYKWLLWDSATGKYDIPDGAYHTRSHFNWSAAGLRFIHIKDLSPQAFAAVGNAGFFGSDQLSANQSLKSNQYLL